MPRDWTKPLTGEDIESLKKSFQNLPTYKTGGWIKSKDFPALVEAMEYQRTPEQVAGYQHFWDKHFGGILPLEYFLQSATLVHCTSEFARDYALTFDKNENGLIHASEFGEVLKLMKSHDPRIGNITYEEFLAEADTDQDGNVNVVECAKWIDRRLQK